VLASGPDRDPQQEADRAALARLSRRATDEIRRADRAAATAASYESRSLSEPEYLRPLLAQTAALHRRAESRHRTSALLHEAHARRVEAWLTDARDRAARPPFISTIAATLGTSSALAVLRGPNQKPAIIASSDPTARAAHDLEVMLAEGPAKTVMAGHAPVLATGKNLPERWPLFGPAVTELGVRTIIAVPLQMSAAWLGALCGYSEDPVVRDDLANVASRIADAVLHTVLLSPPLQETAGADAADLDIVLFDVTDCQAVVHQAAGMISERYGWSVGDAEDLLRARAFADGQPLEKIAQTVLQGETWPG